jgi:CarD family transcriptional regulator
MEESRTYSKGDWIVHSYYGIGQIKGIDVKGISGEDARYYRIRTTDSAFWMPVDRMDSEILRPLATPEEIENAIDALRKPPKTMSSNFKTRQSRIQRAQNRNTPKAIARLIRDLRGRQRDKGPLNGTELSAFRALKQRLVQEWAIVMGTETEKVASRLDNLLDPHREKAEMPSATTSRESAATSSPSSLRKRRKWGVWPKQQTNSINR